MRISRAINYLAISFLVVGLGSAFADDSVDAAVERLSQVGTFAIGGIGFAGVISKGEIDFRLVLAQPEPTALNTFEQLFATDNPQAKAYALFGIKLLNPSRFRELMALTATSKEQVSVMSGCVGFRKPLRVLAKQIEQGAFPFFPRATNERQ